jgi:hypothetical protein
MCRHNSDFSLVSINVRHVFLFASALVTSLNLISGDAVQSGDFIKIKNNSSRYHSFCLLVRYIAANDVNTLRQKERLYFVYSSSHQVLEYQQSGDKRY